MAWTRQQVVAAMDDAARRGGVTLDLHQRRLVDRFADLEITGHRRRGAGFRGLYIYGSAGRGKSWLCDAFFDAAPTAAKVRVHFHSFFDELHRQMHAHRDEESMVRRGLDDVIGQSRLLLFDELHVHDPGDARLLTRLLEILLARRVTVVATSNYPPDNLLPNPIWHHVFEPGIELIETHFDVHHLAGHDDYRMTSQHNHRAGFSAGVWTRVDPPHNDPSPGGAAKLKVGNRQFHILNANDGHLSASFAQLCQAPVSPIEYLQWARSYPRWTIVDIPGFDRVNSEAQQRFINLIDILVDSDVQVAFSSQHTLTAFLSGASARPDAFRMVSRLHLLRTQENERDVGSSSV